MTDLLSIRDSWYDAYFSGDIDTLKNLEAKDFVFVSSDGVEKNENRYDLLLRRVESGKWFKPGTIKKDYTVEVKILGEACAFITGTSETYIGEKGLGKVSFSEVWCKDNGNWYVESLHIS